MLSQTHWHTQPLSVLAQPPTMNTVDDRSLSDREGLAARNRPAAIQVRGLGHDGSHSHTNTHPTTTCSRGSGFHRSASDSSWHCFE